MEYNDYYYQEEFLIEYVGLIITGIINLTANILILVTIFRIRSKSSVHRFICFFAIMEIVAQLFAPPNYSILGTFHEMLHDFRIYKYMSLIYVVALSCGVQTLQAMLLRNHFQFFEKFYGYVMLGICVLSTGCFSLIDFVSRRRISMDHLYEAMVLQCLLLLLMTFIEQMMYLAHPEKPIPMQNKLSTAIALLYGTVRMVCTLGVFLGALVNWYGGPFSICLGLIELNSIVNLILLVICDVNFKAKLYEMLRLDPLLRNNAVKFVNMADENVNILVDE